MFELSCGSSRDCKENEEATIRYQSGGVQSMMNSSMGTRHTPVVRRRSFNMKVDECLILYHHTKEELVIIAHVIIPTAKESV